MNESEEHRDRLIDVLLREHFQAEEPPDLVDRVLAHAHPPHRHCPPRRHRRVLAAAVAAATVLLIVASVMTIVLKPSAVNPNSSMAVSETPRPVVPGHLPTRHSSQAALTAARRSFTSVTVRVPADNVVPFRIPDRIPILRGRVRIPNFSVRLPQSVSPFTITKKRTPS